MCVTKIAKPTNKPDGCRGCRPTGRVCLLTGRVGDLEYVVLGLEGVGLAIDLELQGGERVDVGAVCMR